MKKSKLKTVYICNDCGAKFPTWSGRCSVCGAYNSITEEVIPTTSLKPSTTTKSVPKPINSIDVSYRGERLKTGYKNLDSALGGGFVLSQVVLLSGEPGIGKSTLLLKIASNISKVKRVLYVSGEESAGQIYIRAKRLGVEDRELFVLSETNLEAILEGIESVNPGFVVFDSIQTLYSDFLESSAGSVSQVKYISGKITELSKSKGLISVIVGQVNKEGVIAGPKVLEHTVDTVVQFEGGKGYGYRILKITKNRFSSSGEMVVFNMTERGMEEVLDPSSFFLSEKPLNTSGSVIFPYTEGSKPILIEVQALVSKTFYPVPQRRVQGVDPNRLSIITAALEKYLKINLKDRDIFVNVVGGIEVDDPAVDLPIAAAIISSYRDIPLPSNIAFFGEIGLTGEVRGVYFSDLRIKECEKMGIKKVVANLKEKFGKVDYIELNSVEDIAKILPRLV